MVLERRTRAAVGRIGEDAVVNLLARNGHTLLARNWRWHHAEVDVVTLHGEAVVFHEVKSRAGCVHLDLEAVLPSAAQRRRLVKAAHAFLRGSPHLPSECRFWVEVVHVGAASVDVQWVPEAFDPFECAGAR